MDATLHWLTKSFWIHDNQITACTLTFILLVFRIKTTIEQGKIGKSLAKVSTEGANLPFAKAGESLR